MCKFLVGMAEAAGRSAMSPSKSAPQVHDHDWWLGGGCFVGWWLAAGDLLVVGDWLLVYAWWLGGGDNAGGIRPEICPEVLRKCKWKYCLKVAVGWHLISATSTIDHDLWVSLSGGTRSAATPGTCYEQAPPKLAASKLQADYKQTTS